MASAVNRLSSQLLRHASRSRPSPALRSLTPVSQFHRSSARRRDEDATLDPEKNAGKRFGKKAGSQAANFTASPPADNGDLPDEVVDYGDMTGNDGVAREGFLQWPVGMTREQKDAELEAWQKTLDEPPAELAEEIARYKKAMGQLQYDLERDKESRGEEIEVRDDFMEEDRKLGVMAEGEEDLKEEEPDDEFQGDDITSLAHGDLEQHREIRHYMRLAAWELPLLSKYAQEYKAPGKDRPLRFRHTSYMGETHPSQNKVSLEFCTADLPLTPQQRLKLVKLVGARYNPQTDVVRMSCEMHETAAQNKRYLGDMVDSLMTEARSESSAEGGKDKFDDIPVDFRHVRWKRRLQFPEAWKMTPDRIKKLEAERQQRYVADSDRRQQGLLVDGTTLIKDSLQMPSQVLLESRPLGRGAPSRRA